MWKIAIVEDEPKEAKRLEANLLRFAEENGETFELSHFSNAILFLTNYRPLYDLVFMDIEMPGLNGMEAAFRLRETDPVVKLIFVTNMAHYAAKGYEVAAFRFLIKPVSYQSLSLSMKPALLQLKSEKKSKIQ